MDITNLDDHRKIWKTDAAACAACGYEWQAVYPEGAQDVGLECPACGSGLGSVLPNDDKSKLSPNDDIVERLRSYRPTYGWPEERSVIVEPTMNHVAADEIERLRQQNAELVELMQATVDYTGVVVSSPNISFYPSPKWHLVTNGAIQEITIGKTTGGE